ncbi:MAG: PIG-L family deacetylase [Anaerolineaceae bacterium]|nr:PIG-L family deacetylase [Anaerolineaceae bacterium]
MGKTILAIGAHVGDMELTCGGLMAAVSLQGGKAVTLALTAGEKGAPFGVDPVAYRSQKIDETKAFIGELGGEAFILGHPDGQLPDNDEIRFEVCDIIRTVKPDIIVTHHKKSMHKDHAACHRIVVDAWFYAAIEGFQRGLPRHFARHLYFAENWEDAQDFKPYVYLDVTEGYDLWYRAIDHHRFTVESKSFAYKEYYAHLKRLRGIEERTGFCECFMIPPEQMRLSKKIEEL